MGAKIHGADELIADFDSAAERGVETFKKVVGRGAFNIKSYAASATTSLSPARL